MTTNGNLDVVWPTGAVVRSSVPSKECEPVPASPAIVGELALTHQGCCTRQPLKAAVTVSGKCVVQYNGSIWFALDHRLASFEDSAAYKATVEFKINSNRVWHTDIMAVSAIL